MFAHKFVTFNLIVHMITVISYVDVAHAVRCSRTPEGSGARRSQSTGNFRLRLSDDSNVYKPGRQYTVFLERNSNAVRSRDRPRPSFTGFFVAVEQKNNLTSILTEDFSPIRHGTFKVEEDNTLVKLICGNVVTHTSETAKNEIYVNWTAPEPGSGCVIFRATIIEHRDVWYMDDGPLTKEFCEDEDTQEDFISNVLEECCACYEAKYEITFEGLWSRNTHPKDFPRNVYTTKFGDIIGATHTVGNGFWANGDFASDGLKEVAEMGITRTLESELKNKSDSIRTIIKARGLSYPNITGKTFAVFRVDSEHHLVSFVSMISPSPDWFVGISSLELCLPDCTWLENKVVDLYPWDAGTDRGNTYDSPDQPSKPQEYIRRITSESPNNADSPFYSPSGSKMKPLARLTLLRQRLYEKNCTADQSENEENIPYDPVCENKVYYSDWSQCEPKCKNTENETGKRTKQLKYKKGFHKECSGRETRPPVIEEECELDWCAGQNQDRNEDNNQAPESTDSVTENETEKNEEREDDVSCKNVPYKNPVKGPCEGICGVGKRNLTRYPYDTHPQCEAIVETVDCLLKVCKNKDFCSTLPDKDNCEHGDKTSNYIFYNATICVCSVFTTDCKKEESSNIFETFEECTSACPEDPMNCSGGENGINIHRPYDSRRNRYKNN